MNAALRAAVEARLHEREGRPVSIAGQTPVTGGCIHRTCLLQLDDGRGVFLKSSSSAPPDMFETERQGLEALRAAGSLRAPEPLATGQTPRGERFLLLEAITTGRPGRRFWEEFGRGFAELHRTGGEQRFGFDADNYLGSTPQPNPWCDDWCTFFARHRLGHQLRLATQHKPANPDLRRLGERLVDGLEEWLGEPSEPAALLHGDLWSGNFMIDESGSPVVIDPAVYWGRREADLAMPRLFGGFDARFFSAYEEVWPLEAGAEDRLAIYELYHLLNHFNLFGGAYLSSCLSVLRRLVG